MEGHVGGNVAPPAHSRKLLHMGMSCLGVEGCGSSPQQNRDPLGSLCDRCGEVLELHRNEPERLLLPPQLDVTEVAQGQAADL